MSPFSSLLDQSTFTVSSFTLECGAELVQVPVAYKTWGKLNATRDNVMIICHAFTGSADMQDWWGPLMGKNKAFDPTRYFIFCANVLGSPYGSASPITPNPANNTPYGPEFPPTTICDDVHLHKLVLDHLQVSSVAVAISGSMGGMAVLEWPLCTPPNYIRHIIPIATSACHSAWCISWGEAQCQSIYSDLGYLDGFYDAQPASGLAAARMAALLTYRSRDSFENKFGRKPQVISAQTGVGAITPPDSPKPQGRSIEALAAHNDRHRNTKLRVPSEPAEMSPPPKPPIFSTQSYLRYQGDRFTARFDANCYIHITRKLDTHNIALLTQLPPCTLVISIATDGLFTPQEQREIAAHIPDAELVTIPSPDGHDGFLLEFEAINRHILGFLKREFPELYLNEDGEEVESFEITRTSMFGEAEVDIVRW
ncbi:homoserine O-acetyltransferase [Cyathus striatus]|nr:homoserine O-acetyltransferase [Cyathus striatus]